MSPARPNSELVEDWLDALIAPLNEAQKFRWLQADRKKARPSGIAHKALFKLWQEKERELDEQEKAEALKRQSERDQADRRWSYKRSLEDATAEAELLAVHGPSKKTGEAD